MKDIAAKVGFWAQQSYWQADVVWCVLIKALGLQSTLLLLFSEGLFRVRPSHALNDPPATPPYNVFFKWKITKAGAAAGVSQPALCASTPHQPPWIFFLVAPFVTWWTTLCLNDSLWSVVAQARSEHLQLQLLPQHHPVPPWTCRFVPLRTEMCFWQLCCLIHLF